MSTRTLLEDHYQLLWRAPIAGSICTVHALRAWACFYYQQPTHDPELLTEISDVNGVPFGDVMCTFSALLNTMKCLRSLCKSDQDPVTFVWDKPQCHRLWKMHPTAHLTDGFSTVKSGSEPEIFQPSLHLCARTYPTAHSLWDRPTSVLQFYAPFTPRNETRQCRDYYLDWGDGEIRRQMLRDC